VVSSAGRMQVALLGQLTLTGEQLKAKLRHMRQVEQLDELTAAVTGSFHLVALAHGRVRVQGSVSEARRVFFARVGTVTVAADRADLVAWLCGAGLDVRQLAARMTYGDLPHPLASAALWSGVTGLSGTCALYLDNTGQSRITRRWSAPEPALSLAEGAPAVRTALMQAVTARVRPGEKLAADLSGGLDSTSLCFLAAQAGAELITVTLRWTAPGNEDVVWAERAAGLLPGSDRLVYSSEQLPTCFTGISRLAEPFDEPSLTIRDRAIQAVISTEMATRGARARLIGHGGDQVIQAAPNHLQTLLRRHPRQALRHARGWRALHRWPAAGTVRALLDSRPYHRWLASLTNRLTAPIAMTSSPDGWGGELRLPPWASARAVEAVTSLLEENAQGTEPLAPTRGQHARLHNAQAAGRIARQLEHSTALAGLPASSPFCDDQVVHACLAVRAEETHTPWEYKPLLVAAMRGLVPDSVLARTTKDNSSAEWYAGLRTHRSELAALADHSELIKLGLADPDALRRILATPQLHNLPAAALESTLACETWLRDVTAHPFPTTHGRMASR
jgi:asparagine synthase (glutamine-hydrolysing)